MGLTRVAREFILHWGEMSSRWGLNRTVAQVNALLYLSVDPLTAEDIAEALSVARSNVSTSLRELQNWKLVRATHHMGDRRDFFSTSQDVWQLFLTVVEQRVVREIDPTIAALGRLAAEARAEKQPEVTARIAGMHEFLDKMRGWYQQMIELPPATLRRLMNLGAGVTKWLPSQRKAKGRNDYWRRLCSRRGRRSTNRPYPSFGPNRLGAVLQRGWSGLRGVEPRVQHALRLLPRRCESTAPRVHAGADERRGASRLRLADDPKLMLLDLGCGLGATLRSIARRLPHARLLGPTRVPWQVEHVPIT
jgi:DNA-binding transcriptional regulator GbsR (MarR family)